MSEALTLSLRGAAPDAIAAAAVACGWLPDRDPDTLRVDGGSGDWRERFARTATGATATWGDPASPTHSIAHAQGCTVLLGPYSPTRDPVLDQLAALPFTVAVFSALYAEWRTVHHYRAPSFSESLGRLGWACAFRGEGHARLVSRRWLTHGPWRTSQRAGDLSIVEFHDPAADAETALAQARPAHARMGISDEGGYLQQPYVYREAPRGRYDAKTRALEVVVMGRALSPVELLDACAVRVDPRHMEPGPIRQVSYVFPEEHEARANLPELWVRELECHAIVLGKTVRLDAAYAPVHIPPAWARS